VALAVAIGAGTSLLVGDVTSHEDPGGPERLNDSVKLTDVTALTDQDDGLNGLSEYCIRVTVVHPDHISDAESVDCVDVDWDETDRESGTAWQDLMPPRLPLIGTQGYAGTSWESVDHTNECRPTAPWTLRTKLTESDSFGLSNILEAIGQALSQGNAAGAAGAKLFLYGEAAKLAAKILRELFDDLSNLGSIPLKWESGEGDPSGTVPKGPEEARHFKASGEKTVTQITPNCTPTTTPTTTTPTNTTPTDTTPTDTTPTDTTPTDTTPTDTTTTGTTTSLAVGARASRAAQAAALPCGADEKHILCKNAKRARRSWRQFEIAVRRIGRLKKEPGVKKANVKGVRKQLIRLVGTLTRNAAQTEIKEARKLKLGQKGRRSLAKARRSFRKGVKLDNSARRRSSPARLRLAVRRYRSAHLRLVPIVHRSFNR
jgi:hypothetical protein